MLWQVRVRLRWFEFGVKQPEFKSFGREWRRQSQFGCGEESPELGRLSRERRFGPSSKFQLNRPVRREQFECWITRRCTARVVRL